MELPILHHENIVGIKLFHGGTFSAKRAVVQRLRARRDTLEAMMRLQASLVENCTAE